MRQTFMHALTWDFPVLTGCGTSSIRCPGDHRDPNAEVEHRLSAGDLQDAD